MTYELLQAVAVGAVAGTSYLMGRLVGLKERSRLQAELSRLTDRDDHGRYVKNEIEAIQQKADRGAVRIESTKVARKPRKAKT